MKYKEILRRLTQHDFDAALVGGVVRDSVTKVVLYPSMHEIPGCYDIDIATSATPKEIFELFPDAIVKYVGQQFGVTLVDNYEVATYRKDIHNGIGNKCCSVEYTTSLEDDLSRRDFTVNAMAYRYLRESDSFEFVDPFGGVRDVHKRRIDFVGDPEKRILEDPTRMIRAARMSAITGFQLTQKTLDAIRDNKELALSEISPERVRLEILKAMKTDTPSIFWNTLLKTGILALIFPEFASCFGFDGGKHHRETVWEHLMLAGDSISKKYPLLRLSGYLHDVGKPLAYDSETGSFIAHQAVGADLTETFMCNYKFSSAEIQKVVKLVRSHMIMQKDSSPKGFRKAIAKLNGRNVCIYDFMRLRLADTGANLKRRTENGPIKISDIKELISIFDKYQFEKGVALKTSDLALSGNDIMQILGIPSGPKVGEILRHLHEVVHQNPELNTREELVKVLIEMENSCAEV